MSKNFVVYKSSAGSGKTYTLVKAYLQIALSDPFQPPKLYRKILAITFTNKAATEMKLRVMDALKKISKDTTYTYQLCKELSEVLKIDSKTLASRASHLLSEILHNYSDFSISTIDSFTHKIIKTFAHDLKLPVNFTIETNTEEFFNKVISSLISNIGENKELTELLIQYSANNAKDNHSWDPESKLQEFTDLMQKEDADSYFQKLKKYDKSELLAIQNELNNEIKKFRNTIRLSGKKGLDILTKNKIKNDLFIHGKGGPQNSFKKWAKYNNEKVDEIIGSRIIDAVEKDKWNSSHNDDAENNLIDAIKPELLHIAKETINFVRTNGEQHQLNLLLEKNIYALILLNELNKISEELRNEEQLIFISDFNSKIASVVTNEPSPFIFERLGERYNHFLIDEFQDTSSLQWQNLLPLIDNSLAHNHFNLIVGDGKQSIYRWRNANVIQFNQLPEVENITNNPLVWERSEALKRNFESRVLDTNYRSYKEIIEFNNHIFDYLPKVLLSDHFKSIYDAQKQKIIHNKGGYVSLQYGEINKDEHSEINFKYIIQHIKDAKNSGYQYDDISILVRNNYEGNLTANFLIEQNIPVISSDSLLLSNNAEINCIICFLSYLNNPFDLVNGVAVLNYLVTDKNKLPEVITSFVQEKNLFKILARLKYSFTEVDFLQKNVFDCCVELITNLELEQKNPQYIRFFLDEVNDYLVNKSGSINEFLAWWDKRKEIASLIIPDGVNAVKILTIHKSKGLEFPIVIVPFVNWTIFKSNNSWINLEGKTSKIPVGVLKISSGIGDAGLEDIFTSENNEQNLDNLNLLYVAFTRAVERLHIISYKVLKNPKKTVADWLSEYIKSNFNKPNSNFISFGEIEQKLHRTPKSELETFDLSKITFNSNSNLIKIKGSYLLSADDLALDARQKGIKMHAILSEINSSNDIEPIMFKMLNRGIIQENEKEELLNQISQLLKHHLISEYFSSNIESRNETEIITKEGEILRPDKIIIRKNETIIIDYKTGKVDQKKHAKQLKRYEQALSEMKYQNIKKFLIYLDENKVVMVE